jgi:hypothetical protein
MRTRSRTSRSSRPTTKKRYHDRNERSALYASTAARMPNTLFTILLEIDGGALAYLCSIVENSHRHVTPIFLKT